MGAHTRLRGGKRRACRRGDSSALRQAALAPSRRNSLHAALEAGGYRAARSAAVHLSGAVSDAQVARALSAGFCATLADPHFSEFGAVRRGQQAWMVIAGAARRAQPQGRGQREWADSESGQCRARARPPLRRQILCARRAAGLQRGIERRRARTLARDGALRRVRSPRPRRQHTGGARRARRVRPLPSGRREHSGRRPDALGSDAGLAFKSGSLREHHGPALRRDGNCICGESVRSRGGSTGLRISPLQRSIP